MALQPNIYYIYLYEYFNRKIQNEARYGSVFTDKNEDYIPAFDAAIQKQKMKLTPLSTILTQLHLTIPLQRCPIPDRP
ncbi:hypothetical protein KUH03_26420 [Sphingobacterium sp. E70]|uniref:hypothetical protein n=1 Tax=Sphingobacterium sp. E70 TaxID=2853439 RepID=UPI00211CC8EE|nr:hypothetical protein [Sphingobacterium sp. E70]ULT22820.1 hypothetical protein KUH03_26420 [Sphingobacterium sp. E70]